MAREKGTFPFAGNFEVKKKGMIDARMYCPSYADLLTYTAADYMFNGVTVAVWDADEKKRGVYQLINENELANPESWVAVGGGVIEDGEVAEDKTWSSEAVNKEQAVRLTTFDDFVITIPRSQLDALIDWPMTVGALGGVALTFTVLLPEVEGVSDILVQEPTPSV